MNNSIEIGICAGMGNIFSYTGEEKQNALNLFLNQNRILGVEIRVSLGRNQSFLLGEISVYTENDGVVKENSSYEELVKIKGVGDFLMPFIFSPNVINTDYIDQLWGNKYRELDYNTELAITFLPSGGVMLGVSDFSSVFEMEFNELDGAIEDDELEDFIDSGEFPIENIASIYIDKEKFKTSHQKLSQYKNLEQTVLEWKKIHKGIDASFDKLNLIVPNLNDL